MLESAIERKVVRRARVYLGAVATKLQGAGNKGKPDYEFIFPNGWHAYIEFKKPGEKPRPLQKLIITRWRGYNQFIEVFDDAERAINWLTRIANLEPKTLPDIGC